MEERIPNIKSGRKFRKFRECCWIKTSSPYWCCRCSRFVRVRRQDVVICLDCDSGFVEEIEYPIRPVHVDARRRRFSTIVMYMISPRPSADQNSCPPFPRRSRRNGGDHSPFNPIIVLHGSPEKSGHESGENHGFELYYDDGASSGLRPLPPSMSKFLLGSGFNRLLEQLSHIEINGVGRLECPLASKAAIDSLPTIEINHSHNLGIYMNVFGQSYLCLGMQILC